MVNKNKHKKVWFDLEIYTYFSKESPNVIDDCISVGSYSIDENYIGTVTTDDICDYIIKNPDIFFDIDNINKLEKRTNFRNIKCNHLTYQLQMNSGRYIDVFMFINNVRII